jgi:uncharacterized flavoprotein (TIGR03862 family)
MTPPGAARGAGAALVVGAGPAGLMAAQELARAGVSVDVYDAMPSVGRKFLLAGKGGLNLTHSEPLPQFLGRYAGGAGGQSLGGPSGLERGSAARLQEWLGAFGPQDLRAWAHRLGVDTFVGSSGRVFPAGMKAAPLLRAWLHELRALGVRFHARHRCLGWAMQGGTRVWRFAGPGGETQVSAEVGLLALGGASWARLGSDGSWMPWLAAQGVGVTPLQPSNCGFEVAGGWSPRLRERHAGAPLKGVVLRVLGAAGEPPLFDRLGECVLSEYGLEGNLVYAASRDIRQALVGQTPARVQIDLLPAFSHEKVLQQVCHPRGSRSLASHLKSRLKLEGAKAALLQEVLHQPSAAVMTDAGIAALIKALPLKLACARPIDEAISTAGGVSFGELDAGLMLQRVPGVFCAGEMLDWEAPTGGYLLQACFSSGHWAGRAMVQRLRDMDRESGQP